MPTRVLVLRAGPDARGRPKRFLTRLIDAGRGSSGVYLPETLKAGAEARAFRAGPHMRIDPIRYVGEASAIPPTR